MAPKKIIVIDASGNERKQLLGNQNGFNRVLYRMGVSFLVDEDGFEANHFDSITDGGTYTLGQYEEVKNFI